MKKIGLVLVLLLSLAVFYLDASMLAQAEEDMLLLFARDEDESTIGIFVLNATSGEVRRIMELERMDGQTGHDFGWSPDGRIWAVTELEGSRRLVFFDVQSGEESLLRAS